MCARAAALDRGAVPQADALPEEKVEDQLSTRTASSSSFLRTGSSRDEESPGQSPGSAVNAIFAAALAAAGRGIDKKKVTESEPENLGVATELREAIQEVQKRTMHVGMKIRIATAECHALEQRIEGFGVAQRRREVEVASVWQDVEVGLCRAQEVLAAALPCQPRASLKMQELNPELEDVERLRKEVRRQAVAIRVLQQWRNEAEARHPRNRLAAITAQLAEERWQRSKEIQQEMDEIERLHELQRASHCNISAAKPHVP
mmetsp:Transcript_37733/g.70367  ORF Transcript_37733/g.70367 Transcript_37733/m.70367 type:complete len:261 (+) Transcript_37733:45-827(+)